MLYPKLSSKMLFGICDIFMDLILLLWHIAMFQEFRYLVFFNLFSYGIYFFIKETILVLEIFPLLF